MPPFRKAILFLFSQLIFLQAICQEVDSLEWFIQKQIREFDVPGMAIGVIRGNEVVLAKGYGTLSSIDTTPVTVETIFPIMSCTKAFTSTAVAMLVEENRLSWNDKVVKHLPGFKLSDPSVTAQITVTDLLSHRSGLATSEGDLLWYNTSYSGEEVLRRIRFSPLKNRFRRDFGYQNVMYLAAGMIVGKVSGMSWDQFIKKRIFEPLKMNNSSTDFAGVDRKKLALPHLSDLPVETVSLRNVAPAGSINSTISDMLHWMRLWLNGNEPRLISPESVKYLTSPKIFVTKDSSAAYGLGWELNNGVISHGGGMPGYKSLLTIDRKNKIAIIVLTNKNTYINEELTGAIIDHLINGNVKWFEHDKQILTHNFRFPWQEPRLLPLIDPNERLKLKIYTGEYRSNQYGNAFVELKKDTLLLQLKPTNGKLTGYLKPVAADTFRIVFNDAFVPSGNIIFKRDGRKKITGFIFDIADGDFVFSNLRFKKITHQAYPILQ